MEGSALICFFVKLKLRIIHTKYFALISMWFFLGGLQRRAQLAKLAPELPPVRESPRFRLGRARLRRNCLEFSTGGFICIPAKQVHVARELIIDCKYFCLCGVCVRKRGMHTTYTNRRA